MGSVDKLDAHQRLLRAEDLGIDLVQLVPSLIVVAIAGGTGKIALGHAVILEGGEHLAGVLLRNGINAGKLLCQAGLGLGGQGEHFF